MAMGQVFADRVMELTSTAGTGDVVLGGPPTGFRSFASVCAVGDTVDYLIYAVDGTGAATGEWESGRGTYSATATLTRTTVQASSNAGSLVAFGVGTKIVMLSFNGSTAASLWTSVPQAVPTSTGWRLRFPDSSMAVTAGTSYGVGIAELKWLASDLTTQLASGGTAIASSSIATGNGFATAELYDGSTASGSGWYASDTPAGSYNAWCGYTFASAVRPTAISIAPLNGFLDSFPRTVVVEFQDTDSVWRPIATFYPAAGANNTFQTFTLPTTYTKQALPQALWVGEGIAAVGDSITAQSPGGVNWVTQMRSLLGSSAATPVDGVSGSAMASAAARIAALDLSATSTLLVYLGTNDYGNSGGRAMGSLGDTGSSNTFYGDVYAAISAAYTAKPGIRLVFLTPIQRTDQTAANSQGKVLKDYVDAIIASCGAYSVPVFDMYRSGGFNSFNASTFLSDGLHPNAPGHQRLARNVAGFLLGL